MTISGKLIEDQTKKENSDQKSLEEGKLVISLYIFVSQLFGFWSLFRCTKTRTSPLVLFSADYYSALYGMISDFPQCGIFSKLSYIPMHCL